MRIVWCLALAVVFGCSEKNPNLCCVDAADCSSVGLSEVTNCDDGLVCRGNQCIAEVCEVSTECEAAAPYCVGAPDGRCGDTCTDDTQCPGFGQSSDQTFCVAGACAQCRDDNDCSGATPVCSAGACAACTANDQCPSGVCVDDGTCGDEAMVAYVALTGTATGQCTKAAPCNTIEFAVALQPTRPFIVVSSGTYTRGATLALDGSRRLIGAGLTKPIIKRSSAGAIITVSGNDSLENLQIEGATGDTSRQATGGNAVLCNAIGAPHVRIVDSVLRSNAGLGLAMQNCSGEIVRTLLTGNSAAGMEATDSDATIDACTFSNNGLSGAHLDSGNFVITNSFFIRNTDLGLDFFAFPSGSRIEFNTIADNSGVGFRCSVQSGSGMFPNNIFARNGTQVSLGQTCTVPNSIIIDTDISPIKFVSPDAAPFDYHIQTGSIAIGAASATTLDHDFDGDARPATGATVGADEL